MNLKKKIKSHQKKKSSHYSNIGKKELTQLRTSYRTGKLKFDSKEIAKAILEDKDIRQGLTK